MEYTPTVCLGYTRLWTQARILPKYDAILATVARRIANNKQIYQDIEAKIKTPWWFVGCLHEREADLNLSTYLGNGEPLNRVTRLVPKNRGPWPTWEAGALDALTLEGFDKVTDWSLPHALYLAEKYNGFGYINRCNSPYIWSYTSLYTSGKFTETVWGSHFDGNLVDRQPGVAAMLKAMIEAQIIPDFAPDEDLTHNTRII